MRNANFKWIINCILKDILLSRYIVFFKIFGVKFNEKDEVGKFNQERPVNYFSHKAESAVEPRY